MNILILSVGTRNLVVRAFRQSLRDAGLVIATDMSPLAPALYEADRHYIVPRMSAPGYLDEILRICRQERIDGVLSLIDPELSFLAHHAEDFRAVGARIIGSSYELCELSLDKFSMYRWLTAHGYRTARSWTDKAAFFAALDSGAARFPVFVKPVRGSASISISKVWDRETVELLLAHEPDLMIQEFLDGQEIGADVYIDMISGELISVFTKKKLRMRAGETDKSVSFRDPALFALIERFVLEAGFRGPIDIDIFDVDGSYYISEVNPRFGGGYPHALACGCDHMSMILRNLEGLPNEPRVGRYEEGVYMMKYNEVMIRRNET